MNKIEFNGAQTRRDFTTEYDIRRLSSFIYGEDGRRLIKSFDVIRDQSSAADGASVYLLDGEYILLQSPSAFPDAVFAQAEAMSAMRERLDAEAASVILPIEAGGWMDDRSFLIVPRCIPLMRGRILGRWDLMRISGEMLTWLRSMMACIDHPTEAAAAEFEASLQALTDMRELPATIREQATRLAGKIACGTLQPAHVPMHGDMWQGNILRKTDGSLAIIDWGGSTCEGYAVYDLIRFAHSTRLSKQRLHRELQWQLDKIGCGDDGLALHLLGALGHYALRLGEFPRERFCVLAEECWTTLRGAS